jgi:hypothetical protein
MKRRLLMILIIIMGVTTAAGLTSWTTPLTNPGSTLRLINGNGYGYGICYIAANSTLQCPPTYYNIASPSATSTINIPATSSATTGNYISITGIASTICAISHVGFATCFGMSTSVTTGLAQGYVAQPPYQIFSSITYGTSAGCGILASSGYALCWYVRVHT